VARHECDIRYLLNIHRVVISPLWVGVSLLFCDRIGIIVEAGRAWYGRFEKCALEICAGGGGLR